VAHAAAPALACLLRPPPPPSHLKPTDCLLPSALGTAIPCLPALRCTCSCLLAAGRRSRTLPPLSPPYLCLRLHTLPPPSPPCLCRRRSTLPPPSPPCLCRRRSTLPPPSPPCLRRRRRTLPPPDPPCLRRRVAAGLSSLQTSWKGSWDTYGRCTPVQSAVEYLALGIQLDLAYPLVRVGVKPGLVLSQGLCMLARACMCQVLACFCLSKVCVCVRVGGGGTCVCMG
jgi:hypothetical protein